jgi:pilus assembly protein FimV
MEGMALGDEDDPPPTRPAIPSAQLLKSTTATTGMRPALGDDDEVPTRVSLRPLETDAFEPEAEVTSTGQQAYMGEEATTVIGAVLGVEAPADEPMGYEAPEPEPEPFTDPSAAAATEEEEPASEECDEASFFLDQGLAEEAREILENVMIAFPGHRRAAELMARLEALEAGGVPAAEATEAEPVSVPSVEPVLDAPAERDAFDLAAELAGEIDGLGDEEPPPAAEDFQYSVEEVFAEFKKGLEKVVKPEDVDTHYDLGIAFKEMGLTDDALEKFSVARQGCVGTKRELDCITMIGMLHGGRGDHAAAVKVFKEGLASEHATGE